MISLYGPLNGPEGATFAPINRSRIPLDEALSSWLTGACAPALNLGTHGAGSTASHPAAVGGLFGFERSARQSRAHVEAGGIASDIRCANVMGPARRRDRMGSIGATRSSRLTAPWRLATAHGWRSGRLCGTPQLGPIAPDLQSTRRAQRFSSRLDAPRSAHFERAELRTPLRQHALRERFLSAGLARRAASTIRHFCLRAFQ